MKSYQFSHESQFVGLNSWKRAFAFSAIFALTFFLTFLVLPFGEWKMHFYQAGIFTSGFVFGPLAGAAIGALSSSYNALFVLHNPYLIPGNAILGFFAAYFLKRYGAMKAVLAAFAIQLPYLYATDVYLMGMPQPAVIGIIATLLFTNIVSALVASALSPRLSRML